MKKSTISKLVLVTGIIVGVMAFAGTAAAEGPVHWDYEGDAGPENWGELSQDFALCSTGREQSPIDISTTTSVNPADIVFNYQPSALNILNNGHTIQANYDAGSSIEVDGKSYKLLQFHFHALSEHTIDGNPSPLEMHLVHQSDDGSFAVVGVMINRGGGENAAFTPVGNNMPAQETEATTISGVVVNVNDLLPAERTYYRYNGSFTTPPCTEGVKWFVLSTPIEISDSQASTFEQIYHDNYRPVQSFGARSFLISTEIGSQAEIGPETLPVTGEVLFPMESVLMGLGIVAVGAGLYLKYFNIV